MIAWSWLPNSKKCKKSRFFSKISKFHQISQKFKIWSRRRRDILRTVLESWRCILCKTEVASTKLMILMLFWNPNGKHIKLNIFNFMCLPFGFQKSIKIINFVDATSVLQSIHLQLSKTVLRMSLRRLDQILNFCEIWWNFDILEKNRDFLHFLLFGSQLQAIIEIDLDVVETFWGRF